MILGEAASKGLLAHWQRDPNRGQLLEKLLRTSVLGRREAEAHLECIARAVELCSILSSSSFPGEGITVPDVSFFCQLDGKRSCAGCCDDFQQDRETLRRKFARRRSDFLAMFKGREDLPVYRQHTAAKEPGDSSCRFLGFLDDRQETVGCLLHPKRPENGGTDLRNYGKHGLPRCQAYICAGLRALRRGGLFEWLLLHQLQRASDDWYSYSRLFSPSVTHSYYAGLFEIYLKVELPQNVVAD